MFYRKRVRNIARDFILKVFIGLVVRVRVHIKVILLGETELNLDGQGLHNEIADDESAHEQEISYQKFEVPECIAIG